MLFKNTNTTSLTLTADYLKVFLRGWRDKQDLRHLSYTLLTWVQTVLNTYGPLALPEGFLDPRAKS